MVTHAEGTGERAAVLAMLDTLPGRQPKTVAADKAYDTRDFVDACRRRRVTPHVASNDTRIGGSTMDGRTTRHAGYAISPDDQEAHRGALRLGQDHRANSAHLV